MSTVKGGGYTPKSHHTPTKACGKKKKNKHTKKACVEKNTRKLRRLFSLILRLGAAILKTRGCSLFVLVVFVFSLFLFSFFFFLILYSRCVKHKRIIQGIHHPSETSPTTTRTNQSQKYRWGWKDVISFFCLTSLPRLFSLSSFVFFLWKTSTPIVRQSFDAKNLALWLSCGPWQR